MVDPSDYDQYCHKYIWEFSRRLIALVPEYYYMLLLPTIPIESKRVLEKNSQIDLPELYFVGSHFVMVSDVGTK